MEQQLRFELNQSINKQILSIYVRYAVMQLVEALRYTGGVAGSIPDGVIGIFH